MKKQKRIEIQQMDGAKAIIGGVGTLIIGWATLINKGIWSEKALLLFVLFTGIGLTITWIGYKRLCPEKVSKFKGWFMGMDVPSFSLIMLNIVMVVVSTWYFLNVFGLNISPFPSIDYSSLSGAKAIFYKWISIVSPSGVIYLIIFALKMKNSRMENN